MIGREDWDRLVEFNHLTHLTVGKYLLKDFYDCNNLLKYLPGLKYFQVEGFQEELDQESAHQIAINKNNIGTYNNIETLYLASYHSSSDDGLLYIMNNFTGLDSLTLGEIYEHDWRVSKISSSVIHSFIKFFQKCDHYHALFGGVSGEAWLKKLVYDCEDDNGKGGGKAKFGIVVLEQGQSLFGEKFQMFFYKGKGNVMAWLQGEEDFPWVQLRYSLDDNRKEEDSGIKANLANLPSSTEHFVMDLGNHRLPVGEYIDFLLGGATHVNLKSIRFHGGEMLQYNRTQDSPSRAAYVKQLVFNQTTISEAVLAMIRFSCSSSFGV